MGRNTGHRRYDFNLALSGITDLTPDIANALLEAGCDDGTLAMRSGRPFITFSRSAQSMKDAVLSAIQDTRKAAIGVKVLNVAVVYWPRQKNTAGEDILRDAEEVATINNALALL